MLLILNLSLQKHLKLLLTKHYTFTTAIVSGVLIVLCETNLLS